MSILALSASVACAQSDSKPAAAHNSDPDKVTATGGVTAAGWTGRIDPQSEKQGRKITDAKFVTMGTGFHVTSGPAAVYWNPATTATGNYSVSATFTQTKSAAHAEGYGFVFSGKDLTAPNQSYYYFLIRQDGKFLFNHRANDSTVHKVVPWTDNAAISKLPEGGKSTNKVTIEFNSTDVTFLVNDTEVHRIPRSELGGVPNTSGIVGLRVNHNLDVHVDGFSVTQAK
ncbi:MAG: hypothetical protein H0W69_10605 [Gemmatimonadaceae bacterium]|nr:hypothetical protein [Gemmatimonadaceae bacterium]